jgi:hypothetical protein
MKIKGELFYLQAEISGNYTTIAAMQSNSMTINQETVEITDKSMLFRELLENAGIGSVSTKAQGIVSIQQVINLSKILLLAEQSLIASCCQTQGSL